MQNTLQAIVTIISLVNPLVCMAIFADIEAGRPRRDQVEDANRAVVISLIIMTFAALVGTRLLHLMGVTVDAFAIAGGGVVSWIGFTMLRGGGPNHDPEPSPDRDDRSPSLIHLIIFAAGPGVVTGIITLAAVHTGITFPVTALIAAAVSAAVLWLSLLLVAYAGGRVRGSGMAREITTRFMGLLVIAMGVQIMLTGLQQFFGPTLAHSVLTR